MRIFIAVVVLALIGLSGDTDAQEKKRETEWACMPSQAKIRECKEKGKEFHWGLCGCVEKGTRCRCNKRSHDCVCE